MPDRAEVVFDIRYTDKNAPDALIAQIRAKLQGEIDVLALDPVFDGGSSPYMDLLRDIVPETAWGKEHGASDARYLAANGIPGIVWGANGDMSQHTDEEQVHLDRIFTMYRHLDRFISFAGQAL